MDLKTFRAASTRQALARVRAELGPDALVLDTREVRLADGARAVEVVAARDLAPVAPPLAPLAPEADLSFDELQLLAGERLAFPGEAPLDLPRGERPLSEALLDRMVASEVRPAIARALLAEAQEAGSADLKAALRARVARALGASMPRPRSRPRVVALVGPTGVGKTTTTAKLAARLGARMGKKVGLVAADGNRVGATEQLRIYADLLGVPLRVATSPRALDEAVRALGDRDWVLVDTAGRSPREAAGDAAWAGAFAERPWLQRFLVLAANTREGDLDAAVDAFWPTGPSTLVFTKIDETAHLGSVLNQAVRTGLPVGFLTDGQRVPEDLVLTDADRMAELVLGEASRPKKETKWTQ